MYKGEVKKYCHFLRTNINGFEKLRPLFIGKFQKSRYFKNVISLHVDYDANKTKKHCGILTYERKLFDVLRNTFLIIKDNLFSSQTYALLISTYLS